MSAGLLDPVEAADAGPGRLDRLRALLRTHWLLAVLLVLGATLRVFAIIAYRPAILFFDSFGYLHNLHRLNADEMQPIGYDLILNPLLLVGDLQFVVIVQHLVGIGMALATYRLLLCHGARRWLAALACAPLLLDGYQVQIEHNIMSDVWFQAILLAAVWALTGRGEPTPRRALVAGLLLGFGVVVRLVGIVLVVPAVVYLGIVGSRWRDREGRQVIGRRAVALMLGFAVVVGSYALYFRADVGRWGLSGQSDTVAYGRAASIADCDQLDDPERLLCPVEPRDDRLGVDYYAHHPESPPNVVQLPAGLRLRDVQNDFASEVFRNQPVDLVAAATVDFLKGFRPWRMDAHQDVEASRWQFQESFPMWREEPEVERAVDKHGDVGIGVNGPLAGFLRDYQRSVGFTSGVLLAGMLVVGALGGLGVGSARRSGIRASALLTTGLAVTVLYGAALYEFSWRYQLPGLVLLPIAGALGVTALQGPLRRPGPRRTVRPPLDPFPDAVDRAAVDGLGPVDFAPVVVVIAAYDEEDGIGAVLDDLPDSCLGLAVDTLVVVDGATDATAEVARRHGATVCDVPTNRGQGAALRLGYALARAGGARYVVTTDADGQYDPDELPLLLQPLIDDEADFVTGSRRLGRQETTDPVRHLGVVVFARLARLLTGAALTDTSFGFRAMRPEVTAAVRLEQAQYQASELLISVLAAGYRVVERPMTMRARSAGETKKGNNLAYGARYARVMLGTWWRERRSPKTSRSSSRNLTTNSTP